VRDERGQLTQAWVRWRTVEDFLEATPTSRNYVIDRVLGTVQFGDGTRGMVPPIGVDNVKANYQFGGGAHGNVAAGTVVSLKTSVAGVDTVTNHEPAGGGADTEILAQALERGPQAIKHRNRAIAREDFEWLARQASSNIAKVKCLPTTNQDGEFETGWVVVIIAPHSQETQPLPSAELLRQVQRYLAERCPNVVSVAKKLLVTGPAYVEVSVTADVFATSIDVVSQVQSESLKSLKKFLHPLTGGPEGTGWDFGRLVCLSDIMALLEALPDVDHVDNVSMQLRDVKTNRARTITDEVLFSATLPPYAMIFSGEHNVTVTFQA
jgi:predicted phage baseplate assembly protein